MNTLLLICVVLTVINGYIVQLSRAQTLKPTKEMAECTRQTGIDPRVIFEVKKSEFRKVVQDETLRQFIFCFFRKHGLVDDEGNVDMEGALSKLPPEGDKGMAEMLLNKCKRQKGKDAADKTTEIFKCYTREIKNYISPGFA